MPFPAFRPIPWLALVGSLCLAIAGPSRSVAQTEAESLSTSFRKASRKVLPAVVTVKPIGVPTPFDGLTRTNPDPFGLNPVAPRAINREPSGSGLVIDAAKGLVLTNDHVIAGATQVVVVLGNGRERPVSQVRHDPKSDLALLVIEPAGLVQAEWGDSDSLETGDWVLAIGQPFGLSGTVTAGIVSGKARGIGIALYEDLIQTDAAINPGNSGGPLVNLKGEVVGINSAIKTLGGGYEGIGFAVPSSRARRVAADLAEFGRVRRAYLGVTIRQLDAVSAERLSANAAAMITGVTTPSPASEAGLKTGDVILSVDGRPIEGPGSLQAMIEVARVGEPITLQISRNGQLLVIPVKPDAQPDRFNPPPQAAQPPGININVPGARINVPGPNLNIGPRTNPPLDSEPPLGPLPPALPAPTSTPMPPLPAEATEKPVIRSTPAPKETGPTTDPGPKVESNNRDRPRTHLIAARKPD